MIREEARRAEGPRRRREAARPAGGRRGAGLLALALLALPCAPVAALPAAASRAVLARGPEAVRGLPFFSPNAIPSLRAEYLIVPAGEAAPKAADAALQGRGGSLLRLWYSRSPLVFGPGWARTALASRPAYLLGRGAGPVLALAGAGYTLFFELPEDRPEYRSFALSFDDRFILYFENASSDAELSFPAFVDLR